MLEMKLTIEAPELANALNNLAAALRKTFPDCTAGSCRTRAAAPARCAPAGPHRRTCATAHAGSRSCGPYACSCYHCTA